ncbi:unnamed protein product (macronuclear) [Paramecium tetraurelia]|uniref:Uncharacterized protein n=1 Tax=Paramecium tetraurelia TaxID=5888 RepID=A0DS70_PARTE|nr:uncharacterized protein GSPATT00019591001 [Paramecium tetraurelia]CAK85887.1 unnamed protein product [Paramecium tetraurelia]|eukprot:XP_001453284.1 hypothetical protein (macronuclear) [Paramecium tetraurelia strain d4-2]
MNQQKPPSNSTKKIDQSVSTITRKSQSASRKDSSFQQAAVRQVLVGGQPGDGLWCYSQDQPQTNLASIKDIDTQMNQKFKQIESNIESEIVETLRQQCHQLGLDLENVNVQNQNLKIDIAQQNKYIDQQTKKLETAMKEIENLRNVKASLQSQCDTIKDLYNKTKRDLAGVTQELEQERKENEEMTQQMEKLQGLYQEMQKANKAEVDNLRERVEELEEENEEFKRKLQIKVEIDKRLDQERTIQQNQQKLNLVSENERKLERMGKLLEENATLSEKLGESETLRRRFMEKNNQYEKEIKIVNHQIYIVQLVESKLEVEKQMVALKKRVNDLQVMKSTNQKILEDKINKLQEQCTQQQKQIEKMNQKSKRNQTQQIHHQQNQEEETSDYEDVESKPQLFGA